MRNLCYFCHYHKGDMREKSIKIGGGVLLATALFLISGSIQVGSAAQQAGDILSQLLPEPGYLITAEGMQDPTQQPSNATVTPQTPTSPPTEGQPPPPPPQPAEPAQPVQPIQPAQETCRVNGVDMPGPCSNYPPKGELKDAGPNQPAEMHEEDRERFEEQNTTRWRQDKLREYRDQLREVAKVRKQLLRLKGSQDEVARLDAIKERVVACQSKLNAASGVEEMKDVLEGEECGETGELWEEINRIRQGVELPRELNRLTLDIKRLEKTANLKWARKIADMTPVVSEMKARHAEIKAAYQAGEFEDAWEIIRENFHEKGGPGECQGALHMLRGFIDPLRRIKDPELKSDLEGLIEPIKESLIAGECREAREGAEAVQRELGPKIFQLIFDSERKRRAVPNNVFERIQRLQQKFEALEAQAPNEGANPFETTAPTPQPAQ